MLSEIEDALENLKLNIYEYTWMLLYFVRSRVSGDNLITPAWLASWGLAEKAFIFILNEWMIYFEIQNKTNKKKNLN